MDFLRNENVSGNVMVAEREEILTEDKINEEFAMMESCEELFGCVNYDVAQERANRELEIENILNEIDGKVVTKTDIMPTAETMRYKNENAESISYVENEDAFTFKLKKRDKMLIGIYSVAVMLILALIVLNTGIINTIQAKLNERTQSIANLNQQYTEITREIETVSSDEYVINVAENTYNMSK